MLFLVAISVLGGYFLRRKKSKYLQEAGLSTLVGIVGSFLLYVLNVENTMKKLEQSFVSLFMIILLPPIIFESGFNLQKKAFFKNFGSILLYAFLGTFVASIVTTLLIWVMGLMGIHTALSFQESAAYGSLISATDPVSVLATFKEMNADHTLYSLIFGESVFNDAVTIVLYKTVVEVGQSDHSPWIQIFVSIIRFFVIFGGSFLIGVMISLFCAWLIKKQKDSQRKMKFENVEVILMVLCPWVSYLISEICELSGIVSILFSGIILSIYAAPNLSERAAKLFKDGYKSVAYTSETCVFIFLGMGLFAINHPYGRMGVSLPITSILICLFARAANIYIITKLANKGRASKPVSTKFQFVMWVSGLRGAIAYALALQSKTDFGQGGVILIITLIFALLTILVIGSILNPIIEKCNVRHQEVDPLRLETDQSIIETTDMNKCEKVQDRFTKFNENYMIPFFTRSKSVESSSPLPLESPHKENQILIRDSSGSQIYSERKEGGESLRDSVSITESSKYDFGNLAESHDVVEDVSPQHNNSS